MIFWPFLLRFGRPVGVPGRANGLYVSKHILLYVLWPEVERAHVLPLA